jgi:hypothetical protein
VTNVDAIMASFESEVFDWSYMQKPPTARARGLLYEKKE